MHVTCSYTCTKNWGVCLYHSWQLEVWEAGWFKGKAVRLRWIHFVLLRLGAEGPCQNIKCTHKHYSILVNQKWIHSLSESERGENLALVHLIFALVFLPSPVLPTDPITRRLAASTHFQQLLVQSTLYCHGNDKWTWQLTWFKGLYGPLSSASHGV